MEEKELEKIKAEEAEKREQEAAFDKEVDEFVLGIYEFGKQVNEERIAQIWENERLKAEQGEEVEVEVDQGDEAGLESYYFESDSGSERDLDLDD